MQVYMKTFPDTPSTWMHSMYHDNVFPYMLLIIYHFLRIIHLNEKNIRHYAVWFLVTATLFYDEAYFYKCMRQVSYFTTDIRSRERMQYDPRPFLLLNRCYLGNIKLSSEAIGRLNVIFLYIKSISRWRRCACFFRCDRFSSPQGNVLLDTIDMRRAIRGG